MQLKIAMEERKFLLAQRKLESLRLLTVVLEKVKVCIHTGLAAIENVNTIKESRSNTVINRVFDSHLSRNWRQTAIENTVSSDFLSAFVDF